MPLTQTSSTKLFRASGKCYDENVKKIKASENKLEQSSQKLPKVLLTDLGIAQTFLE